MIQLFPADTTAEVGGPTSGGPNDAPTAQEIAMRIFGEHRPARAERPWVYTNMIATIDGGTAFDGLSGPLGGPADKTMFRALRGAADAILAGASTARDERYRPPTSSAEIAAHRRANGRNAHPRLVVVTRSLNLDIELPMFDDPENRPVVVTVASAPPQRRQRVETKADVITAGDHDVDLSAALKALRDEGLQTVLCEGGPSLNAQLIDHDLIDEWNLSLSPRLLAGDSRRAAFGPVAGGPPQSMQLARVWTDDDFLFCRWIRRPRSER